MHQQILELLMFSIAIFFLPQSEYLYILIVFQILIGNVNSVSLHVFFFVISYSYVWFICLHCYVSMNREIP